MIETRIEGDPAAVTAAATWLRGTLAANIDAASESEVSARSSASGGWEGDTADAYQSFTRPVLRATDDHADRVRRAATSFDQLAAELRRAEQAMAAIRERATAGGLVVDGTVIEEPPSVPPSVVEPGSPEDLARQAAIAKIELYDELAGEASSAWSDHETWVADRMPPAVTDAQEPTGLDAVLGELAGLAPNFGAGVGAGLTGLALGRWADDYQGRAREFRRRSRTSGDPRIRGQADTPAGRSQLDDWLRRADGLGRWGRILGGPAGVAIDVGFGIYDGATSGDWGRAAVTTGASLATAGLVALGVATAPVSIPAAVVVVGGGLLAAGASWTAGYVYDHWDDITDWTGDRVDDITSFASDTWDNATDAVGDAWDAVTPW